MFLDKIIVSTAERLAEIEKNFDYPFHKAIETKNLSYICEIKKASPSKGLIAKDFPYLEIAKEYEQAGASAISVLTEEKYFLGSGKYLEEISQNVKTPTLRKDFILSPYQIYEAKTWGASAVLLISEILEEKKLKQFIELTHSLGMSALVEAHSYDMLQKALACGAKIVGINNRNLETFEVDINTSVTLRKYVPEDILFVAESGITTRHEIEILEEAKVDAVLIGETLMRSENKKTAPDILKGVTLS